VGNLESCASSHWKGGGSVDRVLTAVAISAHERAVMGRSSKHHAIGWLGSAS
jgi:hypothetical protein